MSAILRVLSTWMWLACEGLRPNTHVQICLSNYTFFSSNIKKSADAVVAQDWIVGFLIPHTQAWGPPSKLPKQAILIYSMAEKRAGIRATPEAKQQFFVTTVFGLHIYQKDLETSQH